MDLGEAWKTMSEDEQLSVGQTLAGVNQYRVFAAVLSQTAVAQQAYQQALNSTGATEQQNSVYMTSLQAKITAFRTEWESLVLEGGALNKAFKLFVDLGTVILKLANNDFVQLVGAIALVTASLQKWELVKEKILATNLASMITENVAMLGSYSAAIKALTVDFIKNAIAWASTPMGMATITIAGIFAIKTAIDALTTSQQEYREEIDSLKESISKLSSETESLQSEYDKLSEKDDLTEAERNRLSLLEAQIEANKTLIQQEYEKESKTQHEADTTGKYTDTEGKQHQNRGLGVKEGALSLDTELASVGQLKEAYDTLNKTKAESLEEDTQIEAQKARIVAALTNEGLSLLDLKDKNVKLSEYDKNRLEIIQSIIGALEEETDATSGVASSQEAMAEKYGYSNDQITDFLQNNEELQDQLNEGVIDWEDIAQAMMSAGESADSENESLQNLSSNLTTLSTDYNSLKEAIDEYNSGGQMSLSTLDALINAATNYSGALSLENGQLVLNDQYFAQLAQQKIANAKADLVLETQERLANLAIKDQGTAISETTGVIDTSKASVDNICTALQNMAGDAITAAQAWNVLKTDMDESKKSIDYSKQVDKIRDEFTAQWKTLDNIGKQIGDNFTNYAKSTGKVVSGASKGSAKESKDAWLEAYKAEKDALDSLYKTNVITAEEYATKLRELSDKYLTDTADHQKKYAKEIHDAYEAMYTALKKSAKEALDEEEKRLKKLHDDLKDEKTKRVKEQKKENEENLKLIKAQIDALKRQRDAEKEAYNKKIDELKAERKEYENQLSLMKAKQELAKAEHTFSYVMDADGQFAWTQDQTAVDKAREDALEEEKKQQYERELSALEKARDDADRIYEQRIDALEQYYDTTKEKYDKAVEDLEEHYDLLLEQYEKNYNDFKEYSDKVLEGQIQATDQESTEWGRRLNNLANFVNEYNRILSSLGNAGASTSSNYQSQPSSPKKGTTKTFVDANGNQVLKPHYQKRASGDSYIKSDGAYIVGENPNKEIILGSKLNNGTVMPLSKGDGVVNAKSTRTIAGLLNSLNSSGLGNSIPQKQDVVNKNSNITISNITLPNVTKGEEFIAYLQNFDIDMLQLAYQ